ncbi:hypothetical protein CVU76_03255 [Candidatus Dojkabacteria bacterium HGW-Dojkabacteria-1]|uniref:Major facilitator superfamily (MFS) profile domain-containing protein n=1 Tax=Candidatus Dojkabacteria bacterium HGW-Dojkabacteria-1 TaxID=2013761 RepID=A0A2N2F4B8_9BACT|nr:MAG: hypothetical protein CVU76_03255 [Candidatus Dojkabacteria bacterium HGW-Dojkabacteria-1]
MIEENILPKRTLYKKRFSSVFVFLLPLAIFRLSDSILSYIFPIVLEGHVNSNIAIGVIMALSSIVGLICDFVLPQIFPNKSWKFLLVVGILTSLLFPVATALGDIFGLISMFVIAVVIWGIYYEFILFTEQNFVVNEFKKEEYSKTWGILGIMIDITGLIAPIIGSFLLIYGVLAYSSTAILMNILALSFAIILITTSGHESKNKSKVKEYISFIKGLRYWGTLTKRIVPLLIMAFLLELVSASFWVFGGLFGRELIGIPGLDWGVLVVSIIPTLIGSIIISRLGIKRRKKRLSQISLLIGGLILVPLTIFEGEISPILLIIFFASFMLSFAWPLNDAVYSDLQKRLEEKGVHLMGLSNAGYSAAYIVCPILMGLISDFVGFYNAFSILGGILVISAILLILFTPRKLQMPHTQLNEIK